MTSIIQSFSAVLTLGARAWTTYVRSTQFLPHIIAAGVIWKACRTFHAWAQAHPTPSPVSHSRGKTPRVARRRSLPQFHPDANPAVPGLPPALDAIQWAMYSLIVPIADAAVSVLTKATNLVSLVRQTCQMSTINAVVAPLNTRLDRGIAQLAALPGALTPNAAARRATLRCFSPILFVFCVYMGLFVIIEVSLELVVVRCFQSLVFVATDDSHAADRDEGENEADLRDDSGPGMANAGLIGTLQS